jgi:hypothetical protein
VVCQSAPPRRGRRSRDRRRGLAPGVMDLEDFHGEETMLDKVGNRRPVHRSILYTPGIGRFLCESFQSMH